MNLQDILGKYGIPDPSIVGKLPRGGVTLDFVGHAEITRILIDIDPNWSWEPVAWTADGRPAINVVNGNAVMWGRLTVLGQTRLGVGTAKHDKPDLDKELIGDFLRNAAMRFGICLSLWSKAEWDDQPEAIKPAAKPDNSTAVANFKAACNQNGVNPDEFAKGVGVDNLADVTNEQLDLLRVAYRKHMSEKAKPQEAPQKPAKPEAKEPQAPMSVKDLGDKPRLTIAEVTTLGINKGFKKEERLQIATDVAGRKITNLSQLSVGEMNQLIDIMEAARA